MWFDGLLERPRIADGSEYKPADFYAGLRYGPLVRKSRFSFAELSQKKDATKEEALN